jgi:hypothetical protein
MSLAETPIAALAAVPAVAPEYHYSIPEIAGILKLSTQTVIGYFENEPGVVRVSAARQRFARRQGRVTLRIPDSVFQRVYKRMLIPGKS